MVTSCMCCVLADEHEAFVVVSWR